MAHADTIFAPASAVIKSGVAIIRLSGPRAGDALSLLTRKKLTSPRMATYAKLYTPNTNEPIDHGLVLWFPAPASFTGEDVAELHIHGSIAVISNLLETLGRIDGLRMAEPGEFAKRAFENNKMDLTEAEGLADLIEAETTLQAKQALRQMEGALHAHYASWRQELIHILALLEAYIDFPDEDIPAETLQEMERKLATLTHAIETHLKDNRRGERIRQGLNVVILGPPNAGKSSLLNLLARRDVAIVSETAGTTRDIIEVHLDIAGYPIILADTAGLREKAEDIESEGIRRALAKAKDADIKLFLLDGAVSSPEKELNAELLDDNSIIVLNKSDIPHKLAVSGLIEGHGILPISVQNQEGIQSLLDILEKKARILMSGDNSSPLITRSRHRILLQETLEFLQKFSFNGDLVLSSEQLRMAARTLGQIIGRIDVEDILDELFSQFCIGK